MINVVGEIVACNVCGQTYALKVTLLTPIAYEDDTGRKPVYPPIPPEFQAEMARLQAEIEKSHNRENNVLSMVRPLTSALLKCTQAIEGFITELPQATELSDTIIDNLGHARDAAENVLSAMGLTRAR